MARDVRLLQRGGQETFFWGAHHRSLAATLLGASVFGLWGCGAATATGPYVSPVSASPVPEPVRPAAEKPEPERQVPDLFERGRTSEVSFSSGLVKKFATEFSRAELSSVPIPVTFAPNDQLWLSVDQHAPRPVRRGKMTITSLLTEDVELAPGAHWLVAWRWIGDQELSIQTHAFFVEVEPQGLPRAPGCLVATPALTVNGPKASQAVSFVALPLMAGIDRVEYSAKGPGYESRGAAPPATEMRLVSPPSGDIELSVRCFTSDEERGADSQMITVNADAPDPEVSP